MHLFTTFPKTFEIEDALSVPVPETDYRIETNHFGRLGDMGVNFLVGALINSILSTLILYILLRILLSFYRRPLLHKIKESVRRGKSKS